MATNYWAKLELGNTYHIYNRGINGCNLFSKEENYYYFLNKWKHYFEPFLDVYAYCLMPNHFHFIVSPNNSFWLNIKNLNIAEAFSERSVLQKRLFLVQLGESNCNDFLELQFKDFFGSYSKAINKQENRVGSLFQQRFKRINISTNEKIAELICYTHHNPIHHNFCLNYNEWQHSSYHAFSSSKPTNIKRKYVFDLFAQVNDNKKNGYDSFLNLHEKHRLSTLNVTDTFEGVGNV